MYRNSETTKEQLAAAERAERDLWERFCRCGGSCDSCSARIQAESLAQETAEKTWDVTKAINSHKIRGVKCRCMGCKIPFPKIIPPEDFNKLKESYAEIYTDCLRLNRFVHSNASTCSEDTVRKFLNTILDLRQTTEEILERLKDYAG